uniref:Probable prefoldin subunit 6 n=1 Tax=Salmo salar TaxID=8030 RepID=B5XFK8_SALSA|nr:Probable prefoldin subunit 6 [Salmo salar]
MISSPNGGLLQLQESMVALSDTQKKYEEELKLCESNLQQLQTQQIECTLVLEEVERLEPSRKLYKQIGGALVPQDIDEAKISINKRIDFITGEMNKHESKSKGLVDKLKENTSKLKECQDSIMKIMPTSQKA